ncbi:MAG TPA: methyltransferase [Bryobacteraceae bacterium]|nr:methyltransferase [Bryobacteraceae bacterium]
MSTTSQTEVTPQRIMQLAWGYAAPLMLEAAIKLKVFDVLDKSPQTVDEVVAQTGASQRGLRALLNALVGLQFLNRDANGRYGTTAESSQFLVTTKPTFYGGLIRHTSTDLIPAWLGLTETVTTGKPNKSVNQQGDGSIFFQQFVTDLFPISYPVTQVLAGTLGIEKASQPVRILDLAAGSGVWGIGLAQRSPQVTVTAVDWPQVLEVTRQMATRFGLVDRFQFVAGDLATADFGQGHNVAILGHILHSEGEANGRELLKKTFNALAPGGTIAIAEFLVDEDRRGPAMSLIFAVNMLVATDKGDTFSFQEISGWLREAGFENPRALESPGPSPLVLANKPK